MEHTLNLATSKFFPHDMANFFFKFEKSLSWICWPPFFFCCQVAKIRHKKNPDSNRLLMVENDEPRIR